jgi:hypothetical protein
MEAWSVTERSADGAERVPKTNRKRRRRAID